MLDRQVLSKLFEFNAELIVKHAAGVSHEDSLKPLGTNGNSLNWTLGHIISSRTLVFDHLPVEGVWPMEQRSRYRNGSPNIIKDAPDVLSLEALLKDFGESQRRIETGFIQLPAENLTKLTGFGAETVSSRLAYLQFHETHHVGQLMAAAQAVGHDGGWLDDWTVLKG